MARKTSHLSAQRNTQAQDAIEPVAQQYGAYAVPSLEAGAPYLDNPAGGWAPSRIAYRTDPTVIDERADPAAPRRWWQRKDADEKARHSVEDLDADGWKEQKGVLPGDRRWADNPRRNPPPEDRPTMQMAPRSYSFTRPFDQLNRVYPDVTVGTTRQFNGMHFSMADHRRDYPILGMAPRTSSRNTYRLMPAPWDANIVDLPPDYGGPANARVRSVEVPASSRSYRLM
jgi:hypothetical protein